MRVLLFIRKAEEDTIKLKWRPGINNTDYIVILDGLKEGDDIALINFEEESTEEPDNTVES